MKSVIVLQLFDSNGRPLLVGKSQLPDHSDWLELTALQRGDPYRARPPNFSAIVSYRSLPGVDRILRQAAMEGRLFYSGTLRIFGGDDLSYAMKWQGEMKQVIAADFSQGDPSVSSATLSVGTLAVTYGPPDLPLGTLDDPQSDP